MLTFLGARAIRLLRLVRQARSHTVGTTSLCANPTYCVNRTGRICGSRALATNDLAAGPWRSAKIDNMLASLARQAPKEAGYRLIW